MTNVYLLSFIAFTALAFMRKLVVEGILYLQRDVYTFRRWLKNIEILLVLFLKILNNIENLYYILILIY